MIRHRRNERRFDIPLWLSVVFALVAWLAVAGILGLVIALQLASSLP